MNSFTLVYVPEDEWHGKLTADLRCLAFTGRGSAWFTVADLTQFAGAVGACPIEDRKTPKLIGGVWKGDGTLERVQLHIRIEPIGHRGLLKATVELATDEMSIGPQAALQSELLVTYGDLANFQTSLLQHLSGEVGEATLVQSMS